VPVLDATHDPAITTWVPSGRGHGDFPIQNLPLCVFSTGDAQRHGGVRIGDELLDLAALTDAGLLDGAAAVAAAVAGAGPDLNALFALGAPARQALRQAVHRLLSAGAVEQPLVAPLLHPVAGCALHLPARIGDYTDFYAGRNHAEHVGALFRPDNPLPPNYDWVPIGYHGRASTVRPSGAPVPRPSGQRAQPDGPPVFAPSEQLDYELELGIWVGASPTPGRPVPIGRAGEQIAGYCLLNDWSARDLQRWEAQPLGPFLAKNFATTVSPYVVTPEALAPYRIALRRPAGRPGPLPYLHAELDQREGGLDIGLEVSLSTAAMRDGGRPPAVLARSSTTELYWTPAQLVAHHSSGGCELQPGDLLGSGTVSTAGDDGLGCLLEATRGGRVAVTLPGGQTRTYLADGDEVVLRARAARPGVAPVGFGECRGRVVVG
jgi:fumarylacetoacetase